MEANHKTADGNRFKRTGQTIRDSINGQILCHTTTALFAEFIVNALNHFDVGMKLHPVLPKLGEKLVLKKEPASKLTATTSFSGVVAPTAGVVLKMKKKSGKVEVDAGSNG